MYALIYNCNHLTNSKKISYMQSCAVCKNVQSRDMTLKENYVPLMQFIPVLNFSITSLFFMSECDPDHHVLNF